jgi:TPP-dependent pyruvate/acetoin dehydrogenase alpha subunit
MERAELLDLHRRMLEIRYFEDEVMRLFMRNLVRGSTHLCQGQEAVAVGACSALRHGDTMTCTYRGHGAVLAMGAALDRAMGEILGKAEGLCLGKGGSMHLTDLDVGALGSFAVVGAHLPFACGVAFAAQYLETDAVTLCFFGDGATNIGAFHEAMNLASIWNLPVVFLCENNLYGEYSPLAATTPVERLSDRASSYAMASARVDGNDVLAVYRATREAAERARAGGGPTLIEALTYRIGAHTTADDPVRYREETAVEQARAFDPIARFRSWLEREALVDEAVIRAMDEEAETFVTSVRDGLTTQGPPPTEWMFDWVYAEPSEAFERERHEALDG